MKIFTLIIALIFALNVSTVFASELSNGVNNFGWNYYKTLDKDENIFYSPYSLAAALSLLANGAIGKTKQEILAVLYANSMKELNDGFAKFHGAMADNYSDGRLLRESNLLLIDEDYAGNGINLRFKKNAEKNYGSEVALVDFRNDITATKKQITGWVDKVTNHLIPNYQSIATEDTAVDLLNVIYFKGEWNSAFKTNDTRERIFHNKDFSTSKIEMMHKIFDEEISYYADEKYRGIELPYKKSANDTVVAMYVILPVDENNLNIADDWDAEKISYRENFLNQIKNAPVNGREIHLDLPKFEFDIKTDLMEKLWQVGIQLALTDYAEFYNIINGVSLKIDAAVHQAKVKVDEQGTEAAAVTEIDMVETTALSPEYKQIIEFRADMPFVFVIRDVPNEINLFTGTVNKL